MCVQDGTEVAAMPAQLGVPYTLLLYARTCSPYCLPLPRTHSAPVQDTFRKDANEVLIKDGPEALRYLIESAEPSPINGLYRFKDYYEDIFNFYMRVRLGACCWGREGGRLGSGAGNGRGVWGGSMGKGWARCRAGNRGGQGIREGRRGEGMGEGTEGWDGGGSGKREWGKKEKQERG